MKATSEIIRELREDNNLKQAQVAEHLGISQQAYSNYELGSYEFPSRHLIKLSEFYHVTTDYLLGKTSYKKYMGHLEAPFISHMSLGEYLSMAVDLSMESRRHLVKYTRFLIADQRQQSAIAQLRNESQKQESTAGTAAKQEKAEKPEKAEKKNLE